MIRRAAFDPPLLANGDRYTAVEFLRRYEELAARGDKRKFELIDGVVYKASPVRDLHGDYVSIVTTWLTTYRAETPGTASRTDVTLKLDEDSVVQPDVSLRYLPSAGGKAYVGGDGYLRGPIELAAEVALSSASYDLHQKKNDYRRHGVREYLAVVASTPEVTWFALASGAYVELAADRRGVVRSTVFPGLWLDTRALLRGDAAGVLKTLRRGLAARGRRKKTR